MYKYVDKEPCALSEDWTEHQLTTARLEPAIYFTGQSLCAPSVWWVWKKIRNVIVYLFIAAVGRQGTNTQNFKLSCLHLFIDWTFHEPDYFFFLSGSPQSLGLFNHNYVININSFICEVSNGCTLSWRRKYRETQAMVCDIIDSLKLFLSQAGDFTLFTSPIIF